MTMAIATAFDSAEQAIRRLCDTLLALRLTVIEDRPLDEGTLLVDALGDSSEAMLTGAQEALSHAQRGDLPACHEEYHRLQQRFTADLVSYERIAELTRLGRSRGGEWRAWAGGVRAGIEACRQPLDDIGAALLACWREMTASADHRVSESLLHARR
jgi:hypothetical protein